ncbi:glycosyltransferase family 2 protein [Methylomonas sp. MgM2]
MSTPLVSVVMPVYNGQKHLSEAIESILSQHFPHFELVIIDDGSTDSTSSIIQQYVNKDSRIRFYRNSTNRGLAETLNIGMQLSCAPFVARMDADDIAHPNRLDRQYEFMRANPQISLCGTAIQVVESPKVAVHPPNTHQEIVAAMLFENSLCHPTIFFKKEIIFGEFHGYQSAFNGAEDYDLWQRLSESPLVRFANLSEVLLSYRTHPTWNRATYKLGQQNLTNMIRLRQLERLKLNPNEYDLICHEMLSTPTSTTFRPNFDDCHAWLNKIEIANNEHNVFSRPHLEHELEKRWLNLCLQTSYKYPFSVSAYLKGRKSAGLLNNTYQLTRMLWRFYKNKFRPLKTDLNNLI